LENHNVYDGKKIICWALIRDKEGVSMYSELALQLKSVFSVGSREIQLMKDYMLLIQLSQTLNHGGIASRR
jgi:hypothetical protein